jgi:TIR domain/NACHT domain
MSFTASRNQVFISYSHKDKKWLDKLRTHLKPFEQTYDIQVWDDTRIKAGAQWRNDIEKALRLTRVAVLLVSPDFLSSDFITNHELPSLLEVARRAGVTLLWVAVSASAYAETEIKNYEAANDPAKPLDTLRPAKLNEELVKICGLIRSAMNAVHSHSPLENLLEEYKETVIDRFNERRSSSPHDPQRNILDFYIEPRGSTEPYPKEAASPPPGDNLWTLITPSLQYAKPCILLAEFGMGKTWLLEMIQYRLACDDFFKNPGDGRFWIPLLVKLRGFRQETVSPGLIALLGSLVNAKHRSIFEQLRDQAWRAALGETEARNYEKELIQFFEERRFLFLFDALDEVATDSRADIDRIVTEVGNVGGFTKRSPIILTCRRSFFKDPAQEQSLRDRGFDVFYLWPWSRENILEYLAKTHAMGLLKTAPQRVMEKIEGTYNLLDISSRALLSAMLVCQWEYFMTEEEIDIPSLYERHIETALLGWQGMKTWQLGTNDLKRFMEELAFLMFKLNSSLISPAELDEYFSNKFHDLGMGKVSEVAESMVRDIKTNSFLLREDSNYIFCHTSIWEFLVSRKLFRSLQSESPDKAAFLISSRAAQYRSIINNFLMPMLRKENRSDLLLKMMEL